jgi:hypothetical protein
MTQLMGNKILRKLTSRNFIVDRQRMLGKII